MAVAACSDGGTKAATARPDAGERVVADASTTPIVRGIDVPTDTGQLHGASEGGTRVFRGVPYAAAPVGERRWQPPQPMAAWQGSRDATSFAAVCPQTDNTTSRLIGDEDCLFLNVYAPDPAPAHPLPVLVWLHGGAYVFGAGSEAIYAGNHLVESGQVVVVTVNYRLGALGYLAHRELSADSDTHVSGNYGLLDQRAALQWVQRNIAAFGGDAQNVTLFGESAGAHSICWHMTSKESWPLFHKAIIESGYCLKATYTLDTAEEQGASFAQQLGCSDATSQLTCLRAKSPGELVSAATSAMPLPGGTFYQRPADQFHFEPIVDGSVLTEQIAARFSSQAIHQIPVLHGANTHEGDLFHLPGLGGTKPVTNAMEYHDALARTFGEQGATEIIAHYPLNSAASPNDAIAEVTADAFFVCPARRMAQLMAAASIPNRLYSFGTAPSDVPLAPLAGKAFHSAELPFVFGNAFILGRVGTNERATAEALQGYFLRFARSGDPNGEGAADWPSYAEGDDSAMTFTTPVAASSGLRKANCDFWQFNGSFLNK